MTWAPLYAFAVYVWWRLRRIERALRRAEIVRHDAANRAMIRHRADRWRWREADAALRTVIRYHLPDLTGLPPDDEKDSGPVTPVG